MRHVLVERRSDGFSLDPTAYLDLLPLLAPSLPHGARTYATDPQHYAFGQPRFVKNLKPQSMTGGEHADGNWLTLLLRHSCWSHEDDLTIRYEGVRDVIFKPARERADVSALGDVLIDEVLPDEDGCCHEIACLRGSLTVICRDLTAQWTWADCSERDARP